MRALALLTDGDDFGNASLNGAYSTVGRRTADHKSDIAAFERLLMGIHNHAAIVSVNAHIVDRYNVVRMAIVAWYYAIYGGAGAMVLATSGSAPPDHSKLVRAWHSDVVAHDLAVGPFGIALETIVERDVKDEILRRNAGPTHPLHVVPTSTVDASSALYAYLSGTAQYERDRAQEALRANDKDFKALGVADFRKKAARAIRDARFAKKKVNFVGQAFRYRGKANYRDSIFLSYGVDYGIGISRFTADLEIVSSAFLRMAAAYVRRRVTKESWGLFVDDLHSNGRITIDLALVGIIA